MSVAQSVISLGFWTTAVLEQARKRGFTPFAVSEACMADDQGFKGGLVVPLCTTQRGLQLLLREYAIDSLSISCFKYRLKENRSMSRTLH
jgi:hypothetical protein